MTNLANTQKVLTNELLLILAGLAALGALATNIILPAFPDIGKDFGLSSIDLTATLSSFFIVFAFGQLFVGPLSDRFGRRKLVIYGLITFILGSLICATSNSLTALIIGRIIQAAGVCATSVLSRAIARDLYDGNELARALSLIMVAMAAAPGFSPIFGGALNSWFGWRATFWFVSALALILTFLYISKLGETHPSSGRLKISILNILKGYKDLIFNPLFILPALSVSLVIGGLYTFFSMAPSILMSEFKLTSLEFGVFFASTVIVVFSAGLLAPRISGRVGQLRAAKAGLTIALIGSLIILFGSYNFVTFSIALVVFLFGMGLINPLGTSITLQPFGERAGAASALLGFFQMGCAAILTIIGGNIGLSALISFSIVLAASLLLAWLIFSTVKP